MSLDCFLDGPIIAVSTPVGGGNSALAVLRLSGFTCLRDLQSFFTIKVTSIKPRYAHLTKIVDLKGQVMDEVIIIYYPAPRSFNGENIVEINVHGSGANIEEIISLFTSDGRIRLAAPGEFTYRALKNHKLTLGQVEGLDLLLNATSGQVARSGLQLMNGELYHHYTQLLKSYKMTVASLELQIDFAEDMGEDQSRLLFMENWLKLSQMILYLHQRVGPGVEQLLHPSVIIMGATNAGKSSLFNLLLRENRSLVSKIAGTTRDYIGETLRYRHTNFRLVDTAGLRLRAGCLEREGMKRAQELRERAFFKILVINPLQRVPISPSTDLGDFDLVIFSHGDRPTALSKMKKILHSLGKDLEQNIELLDLRYTENKNGPIGPAEKVLERVHLKYQDLMSNEPILVERQVKIIDQLYNAMHSFEKTKESEWDVAILASELQQIGQKIGELLGIITPEDVLTTIFGNFCIGK